MMPFTLVVAEADVTLGLIPASGAMLSSRLLSRRCLSRTPPSSVELRPVGENSSRTRGPLGRIGQWATGKAELTGLLIHPSGVAEVGCLPTVGVRPVSGMDKLAEHVYESDVAEMYIAETSVQNPRGYSRVGPRCGGRRGHCGPVSENDSSASAELDRNPSARHAREW